MPLTEWACEAGRAKRFCVFFKYSRRSGLAAIFPVPAARAARSGVASQIARFVLAVDRSETRGVEYSLGPTLEHDGVRGRKPQRMASVANMMVSEDGRIGRKRTHNAVVQPGLGGGANALAGRHGGAEGERPVTSVSSPSQGHATPLRSTSLETTDAESLQILQHGYTQGYRTLSRTSSLDDREAVISGQAKMQKWSVPVSRAAARECAFASASRARVSALLRAFRRACYFALPVFALSLPRRPEVCCALFPASTFGGALHSRPTVGRENARL